MPQKLRKKHLIRPINTTVSGNIKKLIILPFMAGILVGAGICSFYLVENYRNPQQIEKVRQKMVSTEYMDKKAFEKPTPNLSVTPANFHIKIPILMYHYVEYVADSNDKGKKNLDINPAVFEYQLKTLKEHNYSTYFVRDIPGILDQKTQVSSTSAVLTFDDGYEDFYLNALPLLKKYQMKGTIYVVNNFIGRSGYLTKSELREIVDSGVVEIGAHTLDHMYLKGGKTSVVQEEIELSKAGLEELLGIKVETFAYPYGAFDESTLKIVKNASFSAAVSVIPGNLHSTNELYYLSRIRAGSFLGPNMIENIQKDFKEK